MQLCRYGSKRAHICMLSFLSHAYETLAYRTSYLQVGCRRLRGACSLTQETDIPKIYIFCSSRCFEGKNWSINQWSGIFELASKHQENNYGHMTMVLQEKDV